MHSRFRHHAFAKAPDPERLSETWGPACAVQLLGRVPQVSMFNAWKLLNTTSSNRPGWSDRHAGSGNFRPAKAARTGRAPAGNQNAAKVDEKKTTVLGVCSGPFRIRPTDHRRWLLALAERCRAGKLSVRSMQKAPGPGCSKPDQGALGSERLQHASHLGSDGRKSSRCRNSSVALRQNFAELTLERLTNQKGIASVGLVQQNAGNVPHSL